MRLCFILMFLFLVFGVGKAQEILPFLEFQYFAHNGFGALRYDASSMTEKADYLDQGYEKFSSVYSILFNFPYRDWAIRLQFNIENYSDIARGNRFLPTMEHQIENSISFKIGLRYYLRREIYAD